MSNMILNNKKLFIRAGIFLAIALLAGLIFYKAAFPGYMNEDLLAQYLQVKTHVYRDWHPPIMAAWLSVLNWFFPGVQALLFFQLFLLWGSLAILSIYFYEQKFSWIFLLLGFLPWIANFEVVLWKDVEMAFSLLAAITLMIATSRKNLFALILIFILLFYGYLVRANAVFAMIPLFWLLVQHIRPQTKIVWTGLFTLLLIFLFQFTAYIFNYKVLHAVIKHPETYMMMDDLVNMSAKVNKNLIPEVDENLVKNCNKLLGTLWCIHRGSVEEKNKNFLSNSWLITKDSWLQAIKEYPLAYTSFRAEVFFDYLVGLRNPYYAYEFNIVNGHSYYVRQRNALTRIYETAISKSVKNHPVIFKPYFWLLTGLVLAILSCFLRGDKKIILYIRALILSSLLYIFGYLPITPYWDFRYIYWSVLAINMAVALFLVSDKVGLGFFPIGRKKFENYPA